MSNFLFVLSNFWSFKYKKDPIPGRIVFKSIESMEVCGKKLYHKSYHILDSILKFDFYIWKITKLDKKAKETLLAAKILGYAKAPLESPRCESKGRRQGEGLSPSRCLHWRRTSITPTRNTLQSLILKTWVLGILSTAKSLPVALRKCQRKDMADARAWNTPHFWQKHCICASMFLSVQQHTPRAFVLLLL